MIEDVVKKVKSILQAGLPAALDLVEAKWAGTDPVTLRDVPNGNYFLGRRSIRAWHSYPSIFLLGEETTGENRQTSRRELSHMVQVAVVEEDAGPEVLQKKMWRYVEAIEDVLNTDPTLGGLMITSEIFKHDYTGNMVKDGSMLEHDAYISLKATERISM